MTTKISAYIDGTSSGKINPLNYLNSVDVWLMGCSFQGLMMYNDKMELEGRLLEYFRSDNNNVTLRLKKNIYWSDGKEINTKDILKTIEIVCHENSYYSLKEEFRKIIRVKILDNHEMEITFKEPIQSIDELFLLPILPHHIYEEYSIENFWNAEAWTDFVGSGPYILVDQKDGNYYFKKNKYFHLGAPTIDEMLIRCAVFTKDELCKFSTFDFISVDPLVLDIVSKSNENLDLYLLPKPEITYIAFNNNSKAVCYTDELRAGFNELFDKEELVMNVFSGGAEPMFQFYPKLLSDYRISANKNLSDAKIRNSSNLDYLPRKIRFGYFNKEENIKILEYISNVFHFNNIELEKVELDNDWIKTVGNGEIDMVLHTHNILINPFPFKFFDKEGIITNLYGWKDEKNIHLLNNKDYLRWSEYISRSIPCIFLYSKYDAQFITKNLKNVKPSPRGLLWNIHELSF